MKKRSSTYYIVLYAIYAALIFVARILDQLITSSALPINFAVITLSVAFTVAFIEPSLKNCFIAGFIFGMSSFISSFIFGKTAMFGFANPLISVFPRMIVGIALFLVFRGVYVLLAKMRVKKPMYIAIALACVAGAMVNTATVVPMMWLFQVVAKEALSVILVANLIPEIVVPALIVPGIVFGVRSGLKVKDAYNTVIPAPQKEDVVKEQETEENV